MAVYTTIDDPSAYFHTQLYTGNGSSGLAITNDANAGDFKPDLLWIKPRSASDNHVLFDSSRGSNKQLKVNGNDAEDTHSPARVTFESDGFDLDTTDGNYNGNGTTYIAWQWKFNGGSTTTNDASATGVGSVDSVYQANTTAGFSIVTWTGTGSAGTIAHGLGATPQVVILKSRDNAHDWVTAHHQMHSTPWEKYLTLHTSNVVADDVIWNDTAPTSTVFSVGSYDTTNGNGVDLVAYLFTPIQGFSKFGSYPGNGDADGASVYTGFKPAYILIKRTDTSGKNWYIFDSKRANAYNPIVNSLTANNNDAEGVGGGTYIDILSNGFKLRQNHSHINASSSNQIYLAFAEHPFVTSTGIPATAR